MRHLTRLSLTVAASLALACLLARDSLGQSLLISELALFEAGVENAEFIEIYNNSDAGVTVNAPDGSGGFALAASDGVARFCIPNGTTIPARGHYLGVNSLGYALFSYPAGNGTTATGDATYTNNIPANSGVALFNTCNPANFTLAHRLDAVGSASETNALYKEGTGYPDLTDVNSPSNFALVRDNCGKRGSTTALGACPSGGLPLDTDNNEADFYVVEPNAVVMCASTAGFQCRRRGVPGPENLSSPVQRNPALPGSLIAPCVGSAAAPNRVRDSTPNPLSYATFGTLDIRRRVTNATGSNVTRLRFRVVDTTTTPVPSGFADLRGRTSGDVAESNPCGGGTLTVRGTLKEEPPGQPEGAGFNASLSAGVITLAAPLAPGDSINVRFLFGIEQSGTFKFYVNVEALP